MILVNQIKKIAFLLIIMLLAFISTNAQTLKYDDIINEMGSIPPVTRYGRFLQFQKQNPYFSNTYIQLGNACEQIISELDPLRNIELIEYWASNAILYYGLFPVYLKANEVRRNLNYYSNIQELNKLPRLENDVVLDYVKKRSEYCKNLKDSIGIIYKALEKSKDHYNNCVQTFKEINETFDNLNEALLQTTPELLAKLTLLDNEYKATITEFSSYQELTAKFPVGKYNQSYEIIPIQTFRLDGLTNSNFLSNKFSIWDYGNWVDSYKATFQSEIIPLRNEINSIQKKFNDNKRRLSIIEKINDDEVFESFDEKFMFRLGKFDNNSLVRELFRYLEIRQDFLTFGKSPLNTFKDSSLANMNRKFRYYHRLAIQKQTSDEYLETLKSSISTDKVNRFSDFFSQNYKGEQGVVQFCSQEKDFLNQTLEQSLNNLKIFLIKEEELKRNLGMAIGSRGVNMPLYVVNDKNVEINKLSHVPLNVTYSQGVPQYISGYINRTDRKPMAYIAKISKGKNIEWIKEAGLKGNAALPNGDKALVLFGYENGCIAIVSGQNEETYTNFLVGFDKTGKEFLYSKVNINATPIFLHFDEINQKSLLALGHSDANELDTFDSFVVCQTDSLGYENWKISLDIQGNLVDIIKSGNNYLAYFNNKSHSIGKQQKENGKWALLQVTISEKGSIIGTTPIEATTDFHINRVFPISNDEISLIGYKSEINNRSGSLMYLILTPEGKLTFKNF
jgi:hypothetical protein